MFVGALRSQYQPIAAHLIPVRRCNLSCAYCNEYDSYSAPVPTADLLRRVDRLARLCTGIITLSGGEPLLHPDVDEIVRHIRSRAAIATVITNGYLLTRERIRRLNRAGLDHLQISIDTVVPDDVSMKSLKLLDAKLRWLAADAEFDVTVNAVVGGGIRNPEDAVIIARRARELGFSTTVGIIHDGSGRLTTLDQRQQQIIEEVVAADKSVFAYANYNRFQRNLARGQPNTWHCGAGCRYLYICEDGLVHWCSQQRGHPGIPLEEFGVDDLRREYHQVKSCAPFCTVGCVHRVAQIDDLRRDPQVRLAQWFPPSHQNGPSRLPAAVRALQWVFVTSSHRDQLRHAAIRLFGASKRVQSLAPTRSTTSVVTAVSVRSRPAQGCRAAPPAGSVPFPHAEGAASADGAGTTTPDPLTPPSETRSSPRRPAR